MAFGCMILESEMQFERNDQRDQKRVLSIRLCDILLKGYEVDIDLRFRGEKDYSNRGELTGSSS